MSKMSMIDHIIPTQKLGSDLTVLDVINVSPHNGKSSDNVLLIIYKDDHDIKRILTIKNPEIRLYFANRDKRDFTTPREYMAIEDCYSVITTERKKNMVIIEEMKKFDDATTHKVLDTIEQCWSICNSSAYIDNDLRRSLYRAANNIANKWPYVLFSDVPVEEYYRIMLGYQYNQMRSHTIDKVYLDIENDVFGLTTTQCQLENLDPVNACTLIFRYDKNGLRADKKTKVVTFALWRPDRYRQQQYLADHIDEFYADCHKHFDCQRIMKNGEEHTMDTPADYDLRFFEDEAELLKDIFRTINEEKPDVCNVWNIAYDFPKMAARMELLGLSPAHVMSDPSIPEKYHRYIDRIDHRPLEPSEKTSSIRITSTTVCNDQMQTYASIRRGRKATGGSMSLDNVANLELGMGKLKFPNGVDVTNAAIYEYWLFLLYNIRDVWCQALIDDVTNDTMSMVYNMNQSATPLKHLYKQVTYQRQIYYMQRLKRGFVSGNNPNTDYVKRFMSQYKSKTGITDDDIETQAQKAKYRRAYMDYVDNGGDPDSFVYDDDDSEDDIEAIAAMETGKVIDFFRDSPDRKLFLMGGMVGSPDNNMANGVELIDGAPSKHIHDDVLDMDFASEYPWAKYTRSMSKSTQFGRLIIPERISDRQYQLPLGQEKREKDAIYYTSGSEFTSDYLSGDILSLGNVWFNLPSISEMVAAYKENQEDDQVVYIAGEAVHNFNAARFKAQIQKAIHAQSDASSML